VRAVRASQALRSLLTSPETEFLLEAHSGVSARIAEEAGFRGIWASGLAISAQCGVRDHNELSWTQVLEVVELMVDATSLPVLLDGDTGYGDFNNLRRLVRKLEQIGGAGVCIEDKCFPKTNSFIHGERQPLADVDEFCGKIKAGKDSQTDPDFCLIARVEALIAGWPLDEALRRAEAYRAAGADAILIHSKRADPLEVLAFAAAWKRRAPLVIVPTAYASTPTPVFRRAGIALVVWANALIRASVAGMQRVAGRIHASESLLDVESDIAKLGEIFRLQGADELIEAERRYAPSARARTHALILAATRGSGLEAVTEDRPKVMLTVAGRPLLARLCEAFKGEGVHDIHVVAGYRAEALDASGVRVLENREHASCGELRSLACGMDALGDDAVVLYGDLLFRPYILRDLLRVASGDFVIVVDSAPLPAHGNRNDLAYCSAPDDRALYQTGVELRRVSRESTWQGRHPDGRWIGMLRVRGPGIDLLRQTVAALERREDTARAGMPELLNALVEQGAAVRVLYVHGHWLDVNDLADLERANAFAGGSPAEGSAA